MGAEVHSHRIDAHGAEEWVGDGALVFPYWSFTKTAIAICALLLAERGEVDLDTRVPGEAYTLRQLLNHTAGLPDYGALTQYHRAIAADVEPWSRATMMQRAMAGGPLFAPGEGWAYSNIGMMLAREHIETASGSGFRYARRDFDHPAAGPRQRGSCADARRLRARPLDGGTALSSGLGVPRVPDGQRARRGAAP